MPTTVSQGHELLPESNHLPSHPGIWSTSYSLSHSDWNSQKVPSQVICGRSERQTILELERTQKATLQMRKLRLIGLPKATQLFISKARAVLGWSAQREGTPGQPIKENLSAIGHKLADR